LDQSIDAINERYRVLRDALEARLALAERERDAAVAQVTTLNTAVTSKNEVLRVLASEIAARKRLAAARTAAHDHFDLRAVITANDELRAAIDAREANVEARAAVDAASSNRPL